MPLSPGKKGSLGAYAALFTVRAAALQFNTSPSTAQRAKVKYLRGESQLPAKRSGRPRLHTKHDVRRIKTILLTNQWLSNEKILHLLATSHPYPMSLSTLLRLRRSCGLIRARARRKPYLKPATIKARLLYAQTMRLFDWTSVMFTDEAIITTGRCHRPFVTRPKGHAFDMEYMTSTFRSGRKSCPVWAGIWDGGRTPLVRIDLSKSKGKRGGMTGQVYLDEIVKKRLLPAFKRLRTAWTRRYGRGHCPWVLEDNHKAHIGKPVRPYGLKKGMRYLPHPATSPDLNPIEHAWAKLKSMLNQLERRLQNPDELFEVAAALWLKIPQEELDNMVNSMPRRLRAVRLNRGGPTKY
ncbi:Transposable element Tcb2 transposase [Vanrija pseudolonga]|uniref:Transposable element Tcb2 transposase n=1 Tax=Vanrija pseudolonga TaxID=143232 RepID=A0AAF0YLB5_9TREE|nr:Transposable element Tcb2 transposase [Vanrija pseudolonga]